MAKRKGLLTPKEFKQRYKKEVHSLLDAIKFSIEKYKRLLGNWDTATAKELARDYIGEDSCALCRFFTNRCSECPLQLEGLKNCTSLGHPWDRMDRNLYSSWRESRKARARKYAEEILRILRKKARSIQ